MGVAHVGLVHCDPCKCKVKGFRAVSSIERNVSNRRHLQGVRQDRPRTRANLRALQEIASSSSRPLVGRALQYGEGISVVQISDDYDSE